MNATTHKLFLLLVAWLFLGGMVSCNRTKDKTTVATTQNATDANLKMAEEAAIANDDYENFRNMSLEERWRSFTPERRNYLRQNPDLYAYFKPFIAAEPNMEPEGTIQYNTQQLPAINADGPDKIKTPEEWWNSFSEERKQFMRENPQLYPDFVQFFNK